MRTPAQHRKGIALMIGATLCWATAGVLVRNMEVTSGWTITFWRSLLMSAFLLVVLSISTDRACRIEFTPWAGRA